MNQDPRKFQKPIRLSHKWLGILRGAALLLLVAFVTFQTVAAQRAQFKKWNGGVAIGFSPMNGNSLLPTFTGHFRNLSAEISPYAFSHGIMATYHFAPFPFLKKGKFSLDAAAFFARHNANWYAKFPWTVGYPNVTRTGLLGGGAFYFLRRFAFQFAVGVQYVAYYGPPELLYSPNPRNYFLESGSIGIHFRLFKTFQP